jgi:hypothetical protein
MSTRHLLNADTAIWLGAATDEQIAASDAAGDTGIITIDAEGSVIPEHEQGQPWVIPPLRRVYVESPTAVERYDALAARYRAALVRPLRESARPMLATRLENVTHMDPEEDRLAWLIADCVTDSEYGPIAEWMRSLPTVWERSMDVDELAETVGEMERLYPPVASGR